MTSAIDRLEKHLNKEEMVDEMDKSQKGSAGWNLDDYDYNKGKWSEGKPVKVKDSKKDFKSILDKAFRPSNKSVKEEVELDEMDQKFIDSLNKLAHKHKEGDRVTVDSKFFGKQKGKVTKVDKQSVHVQRDGKKSSEKYPHNAVMKEESEQIDEISHDLAGKYLEKVTKDQLDKHGLQPNMYAKLEPKRQKGVDLALDKLAVKEDIYQDGTAPTQTSFDGANAPDNTEPSTSKIKTGLSKSARIIKSLYKHHGIKEELYDSEKEDKSVATYGKKPKMIQTKPEDNLGDNIPQAAAVLTGGKTLTGQTRDTLEIDPEMKKPTRPDAKQTEKNKDK